MLLYLAEHNISYSNRPMNALRPLETCAPGGPPGHGGKENGEDCHQCLLPDRILEVGDRRFQRLSRIVRGTNLLESKTLRLDKSCSCRRGENQDELDVGSGCRVAVLLVQCPIPCRSTAPSQCYTQIRRWGTLNRHRQPLSARKRRKACDHPASWISRLCLCRAEA